MQNRVQDGDFRPVGLWVQKGASGWECCPWGAKGLKLPLGSGEQQPGAWPGLRAGTSLPLLRQEVEKENHLLHQWPEDRQEDRPGPCWLCDCTCTSQWGAAQESRAPSAAHIIATEARKAESEVLQAETQGGLSRERKRDTKPLIKMRLQASIPKHVPLRRQITRSRFSRWVHPRWKENNRAAWKLK